MRGIVGKIGIITGAAGGIGAACARMLAKEGAKGLVLADVNEQAVKKVGAEIEAESECTCLCEAMDLRQEESTIHLVEKAKAFFGRIDILVNSAGISRKGGLYDVTQDEWDMTFAINVRGLFFLCREVFRVMQAQGGGSIINITSQAGRQGGILVTPDYPASKGAVITLTKSLAKAGAKDQVRVNSVAPGLIATGMTVNYNYDPATVPLGRIGTGEDVAGAVVFLASDYASYITGASIDVNGGIFML